YSGRTSGAAAPRQNGHRATLIDTAQKSERLRINEIFHSLQGEADAVGYPTVFVRLTGCPLRCQYCDTEYAFHAGDWLALDSIVDAVRGYGAQHVCVTGGEPLAQPNCLKLLERLCDAGFLVSLETSGALDIAAVDARVSRVVDVKTPGSQEAARNRIENFSVLTQRDQLKFVICSREDYDWSKAFLQQHGLSGQCRILFSPSYNQVSPTALADWILADRLPVRFQLQLHKVLWGDTPGK
ncbi:MAG TPA: 7-carboxy-7-deazaguanine synthase QueE, partial [Bryobacteraceae bacterium]|nr:7-carboxy-7-deazaguanine synthase QueE [Bryobacteraceae bacterium]